MSRCHQYITVVAFAAMCSGAQNLAPSAKLRVNETFDGRPFEYTIVPIRENPRHTVFSVSYPSPMPSGLPQNDIVPAEIYLPKRNSDDQKPRPAVICLHILNGDFVLVRLLCTALADSGVPAMMFKLPYYGERCPPGKRREMLENPALLGEMISQGLQDVRRAVDLLHSRPEIDSAQTGIAGISLGAIVGATACGIEPRLKRGCFILGGGDVISVLKHARETRRLQEAIDSLSPEEQATILSVLRDVDPMAYPERLGALGKDGRIMMINAAEDEVIPRACTEKLAQLAGVSDDVIWLPGLGHYTAMAALPQIITQTVQFFQRDLSEQARVAAVLPESATPFQTFVGFLGQVGACLGMPPGQGKCHYASLTMSISLGSGKPLKLDITFIRGSNGRFVLRGNIPEIGKTELGFGEYPWMVAKDGSVFVGIQSEGKPVTPAEYIDAQTTLRFRMLAGVLAGVSLAPSAFEPYANVSEEITEKGRRISFELKHPGLKGEGVLLLGRESGVPKQLMFAGGGVNLEIEFKQWHIDTVAAPELFLEPRSGASRPVPAEDLCKMLAEALNFAVEKIQ